MKRISIILLTMVLIFSSTLSVSASNGVEDYLDVINKLNAEYGANISLAVSKEEFYDLVKEDTIQEFEELLRKQYEGAVEISENADIELSETIEVLENKSISRANQLNSARIYSSFTGPNNGIGQVSAVVKVLNKDYISDITSFGYTARSSGYYFETRSTSKTLSGKTGKVKYTGGWKTSKGLILGVNYSITITYNVKQVV